MTACRNFASHLEQLREILTVKHRFWAFVSTDSAIFVWDFASAQAQEVHDMSISGFFSFYSKLEGH